MILKIVVLLCLFVTVGMHAQHIQLIDKTTRETLPGVFVFNRTKSTKFLTDSYGKLDCSHFEATDSLDFYYSGYTPYSLLFSSLQASGYLVELESDVLSFDVVIVSSNRWEQEQVEVPHTIKTIQMKDVLLQNPQTTADILETSGYAFIQKSQLAGGSPMLRGFATNRVLIVVDGVRLNNAIFRAGNVQNVISLDANSLSGTEILFGPGAVIYGSDAIGGVMDFRTLKASVSSSDSPLIKGSVFNRVSSANNENTFHFDYNYGTKKWAFLTAFTTSKYDDLLTGSHGDSAYLRPNYVATIAGKDSMFVNPNPKKQVESGFSQFNLIQKIHYQATKELSFHYGFVYAQSSNAPRYDRLTLDRNQDGKLDFANWYYGPQVWMMHQIGANFSKKNAFFDQGKAILAYQRSEESRHDRRFGSSRLRNQYEKVDAYSLNIDLDKKINTRFHLFYGLESIVNRVGSHSDVLNTTTLVSEPNATRYPNGSTWQMHSAYASAKFHLTEKWLLTAGLRYSFIASNALFDSTFFAFPFDRVRLQNSALNGSIGTVYSPQKNTQIYSNISTGFRAPNIDDIGKVFESEPGNLVVPNPNLKPEFAFSGEVGFAHAVAKFLHLDAAVYGTILEDALARSDFQFNGQDSVFFDGEMSKVQAIQNTSRAYVFGFQGGFHLKLWRGFSLKSSLSWQKGGEQNPSDGLYFPKPHVAPLFGRTSLGYERKKWRMELYAVYNGEMAFSNLPLTEIADAALYAKDANDNPYTPAWATYNVKFAWFVNKSIVISGGIENITDQLYRTYSSGISSPGRNYILAVKARF